MSQATLQSHPPSGFSFASGTTPAAPAATPPVQQVRGQVRVGSMMADAMARTLFDQEAPVSRHLAEKKLRLSAQIFLEHLHALKTAQAVDDAYVQERLARLDEWMAGKLSGQHLLALARELEILCPSWISSLPRLLAGRYEELRVARLWSSLLNPEALRRLREAIEAERGSGGMNHG